MEQNLNQGATETREPLPTFGVQPQPGASPVDTNPTDRAPLPTYDFANVPAFTQPVDNKPARYPDLEVCVDSAFGKGLAATILASFPFTSLISIFLGAAGQSRVNRAKKLAAQYGVSAGGKNTAANVLSKIGLIYGIVMTAFWLFYIFYVVFLVGLMYSMGV